MSLSKLWPYDSFLVKATDHTLFLLSHYEDNRFKIKTLKKLHLQAYYHMECPTHCTYISGKQAAFTFVNNKNFFDTFVAQ